MKRVTRFAVTVQATGVEGEWSVWIPFLGYARCVIRANDAGDAVSALKEWMFANLEGEVIGDGN